MRIGIYDLDRILFVSSKSFPNYALMCISSYHKQKGDSVAWYSPLWHDTFKKIYCSSVFDYSDKSYVTDDMIIGGSGFDKNIELPTDIKKCDPDYSIYPECDYSIFWFDIGCPRNCPFCINNNNHREVNRLTINLNGNHIKVQDDNFFYGDWQRKIENLLFINLPTQIQNIDARIFKKEHAVALNKLKLPKDKQHHMAWDDPREKIEWEKIASWVKPRNLSVYVLIGYWSTFAEDMHRVLTLENLGLTPFVMPYNKFDKYQMDFARWVNFKAIFKKIPWEIYSRNRFTKATIDVQSQ